MSNPKSPRCPFCNSGPCQTYYNYNKPSYSIFRCGTKGPNKNGEYDTGNECDKICFRNAYLRCLDILEYIYPRYMWSEYPDDGPVFISRAIKNKIKKELE